MIISHPEPSLSCYSDFVTDDLALLADYSSIRILADDSYTPCIIILVVCVYLNVDYCCCQVLLVTVHQIFHTLSLSIPSWDRDRQWPTNAPRDMARQRTT